MANSYTECVVLSQQLITCLRGLAVLAQRSADIFHDLGDSVTAIDATLSRLSVRATELDQKVGELRAAPNGQATVVSAVAWEIPAHVSPRQPLAPISESPSPTQRHKFEGGTRALSLFTPDSRPTRERERYASVCPLPAPVPGFVAIVSAHKGQEQSEEDEMKRAHHPSVESVSSFCEKTSIGGGTSRRSSWRESFRLPNKRRRRQTTANPTSSAGRSGSRPRSVDFSHRHTVHDTPMSIAAFPPTQLESSDPSSSTLMDCDLESRKMLANGGVRRQHAKSIGEVPSALMSQQQGLDEQVISALVQRTLHLSGHLDYGLHRPQSSHFSSSAATSNGGSAAGPSERSQSCNGLLEQDGDDEQLRRNHYPVSHLQQAPMPPPRQGSLLRASSMPMSPDMVVAGGVGVGRSGGGPDSGIDTPKLKRSMSISQRARALFRPASTRRSRSRSKEGHLADSPEVTEQSEVAPEASMEHIPSAGPGIGGCVAGSTDNVERRRKGRGRSKSPISWLLSRINPPGQQANQPPHHLRDPSQLPPRASGRAVSCVESALTVMPIDTGEETDVFETIPPPRFPTAASSMAQLFRRRSRSREKGLSPKKVSVVAGPGVPAGSRLAGQYRPGSRSPGSEAAAAACGTYHRYRADSDDVDFYVRRHIIDFPSQDADDFHVDFSRLATLRLRREALLSSSVGLSATAPSNPAGGPGPEPAVPLAHVRHFLQSGRDLMSRRSRHRHSRRQADRYSADATPSTPGTGSETTPVPSPGLARMQAVRPSSLTFKQQPGPPSGGPTSPRLRAVNASGVAGVGSLAEQLDKLSSQFCNAVSLRRGYKGSGSRSSSGHWSVSTSSLHPKRSSYMSTVGQPTSPLSTISAALPGPTLPRSVSKDSALDSSSPCERPVSDLVNVSRRSVEVQTDPKTNVVSLEHQMEPMVDTSNVQMHGFGDDDVFCRSSAETLSSAPPAPPPRSASLRRTPGAEVENLMYQTKMAFTDMGEGYSVQQRSRPTTPGRSAESNRQPLPVTLPYRSGTLPRNLKSRLKGGADTLKRLESNYRAPDDYGADQAGTGDTDSDSMSCSDRRASSSASDAPPLDTAIDPPAVKPVDVADIPHYAVVDLSRCSPLPSSQNHLKNELLHQRHLPLDAGLSAKAAVVVEPTGPSLLPQPHHLRSPHLSSNSHLSSFSGDSDTGSSCSGPNPYQRLYSLSTQTRSRQDRGAGDATNSDGGRAKYVRTRHLLQESSG